MPLYFAYGLNMDVAGMAKRCPNSRALGLARLPRHRFIVTTDGYASVIRDPRDAVHGVLWDCALSDIRTLDKFEDIASGLYVKINQPVIVAGGAKRALVYVGRSATIGKAQPGYMETVIASAKHWALPDAYVAAMTRFLSKPIQNLNSAAATIEPANLQPGPVAGVRPRAAVPSSTLGSPPLGEEGGSAKR
ncbi:gamma-glutamylcyclotransferase [Bosea caraganae]|uniref:Gamma-glutamylcyclotransferase n=1 Tax=Bosea caraganae TaxID=2763117 RepID=A0A370LDF9_9HYPH|nr:gamma-glutamylcyclotransferase family protein [Bosea caraganae]RDJ27560.1 gamma-glutamylcyclotransferase [Bosea caraganae]RDJ29575.1 gamma-glutamylcyclotransferase [Bosea caraganae]